jgi:diketogulonate reductase-like aldo/keto reductase
VKPERIEENMDVFDFELSSDVTREMDKFDEKFNANKISSEYGQLKPY